jgi:N-acetylneuraminic acid mutarotase
MLYAGSFNVQYPTPVRLRGRAQQAMPVMQSECYDPMADQWTIIAPLSVSHKEASCVVYNDHIYVLGGYNETYRGGIYTHIYISLHKLE